MLWHEWVVLIAEPEGPTFISYKVARSRLDRLRFVTQDPLRKSATGSGSGAGRLVVEIVGGVTEVSLHVRYGGISGPRSAPYQTDV